MNIVSFFFLEKLLNYKSLILSEDKRKIFLHKFPSFIHITYIRTYQTLLRHT